MDAYKTGPLLPTTKHNIRWTRGEDDNVYMMHRRPLTQMELDLSPPTGKTFLLEEPTDNSRIAVLESKVEQLESMVNKLESKDEQLESMVNKLTQDATVHNDDLYKPLLTCRELAIHSLLIAQAERLDKIMKQVVSLQATETCKNVHGKTRRKAAKKEFMSKFALFSTYAQLLRAYEHSWNPLFGEVLVAVEEEFVRSYEGEVLEMPHTVEVRESMKELMFLRKLRNMTSVHLFDYQHHDRGRESTKREEELARHAQAKVLLDIRKAVQEGWLVAGGILKILGSPTGTLLLEVSTRINDLERVTGVHIREIAAIGEEEENGAQKTS